MRILLACMTGFGLDLIFGDPYWLYHPIRLIGHLISFFGKTAAKCGGKITEKTDCGRGNSVAPGDFDQYRDSMSDAVGGREDPSGCFVSSGMLLVLPDPGGTFTFCGE